MANNEAKIRFTAETTNFNNNIRGANQNLSELRSELRLNDAQMTNNGRSVETLENRVNILGAQYQENESIVQSLNQKLEVASRIFGENSQEASRLRIQINSTLTAQSRLENQINNTNRELDELRNTSRTASNSLNNLEDSAQDGAHAGEEVAEGWTVFQDVISDLISEGIQSLIGALGDLSFEANESLTLLQAKTGATNEMMEDYEGIMNNIYNAGYGESFDDVANAMDKSIKQMGNLNDADLTKVTKNVMMLEKTFEYDYDESLRSVNSLMNQFGITSDEAFNLLVQGTQNGLNANGDMLDVINEYSVQFSQAGYSANDMFNMLVSGVDAGTWSVDKLGDAVKEMNIRMSDQTVTDYLNENRKTLGLTEKEIKNIAIEYNKGGESSTKAVNKMIDSILNVKNETEQYKLGVAVFGTMWEDLGATTIQSLFDTQGEISKTIESTSQMSDNLDKSLNTTFSTLSRTIKSDLLQPISDGFTNVLQPVLNWMNDNLPIVEPIIIGLTASFSALGVVLLVSLAPSIWANVTAMLSLNTAIWANPITWVIVLIVGLVASLIYLWNTNDNVRNAIVGFFTTVWDWIKKAGVFLGDFFTKVGQWFVGLWNNMVTIGTNIGQWFSNLFTTIGNFFTSVGQWFVNAYTTVTTFFTNIFTTIGNFFVNMFTTIGNFFVNIYNTIINSPVVVWFRQLGSSLLATLTSAFQVVVVLITGTIQIVSALFTQLVTWIHTNILQPIQAGIQTFISISLNLLIGLWNNIKNIYSVISNWVNTNIITPVKNKITSFVNTAKSLFTSLWNGIKNIYSAISGWVTSTIITPVKNKITSFVNTAKNLFTTMWNGLKNGGATAWNGLKSTFSSLANFFGDIFGKAWNKVKSIFSTGGKVFSGIKEGIGSAFKSVVNTLIRGINAVVSTPFKSINSALGKIRNVSVAGISPFTSLPTISIPSIPYLEKGGILTKATLNVAGENGAEAVIPLERLQSFVDTAFKNSIGNDIQILANAIYKLVSKDTNLYINGRKLATVTATDNDVVNANRLNLLERGVTV